MACCEGARRRLHIGPERRDPFWDFVLRRLPKTFIWDRQALMNVLPLHFSCRFELDEDARSSCENDELISDFSSVFPYLVFSSFLPCLPSAFSSGFYRSFIFLLSRFWKIAFEQNPLASAVHHCDKLTCLSNLLFHELRVAILSKRKHS